MTDPTPAPTAAEHRAALLFAAGHALLSAHSRLDWHEWHVQEAERQQRERWQAAAAVRSAPVPDPFTSPAAFAAQYGAELRQAAAAEGAAQRMNHHRALYEQARADAERAAGQLDKLAPAADFTLTLTHGTTPRQLAYNALRGTVTVDERTYYGRQA